MDHGSTAAGDRDDERSKLTASDLDGLLERLDEGGSEVAGRASPGPGEDRRRALLGSGGHPVPNEERAARASAEPRSGARRRLDAEQRLAGDIDLWVASASPTGSAHLVPLSFVWDGVRLLLATPADTPTGRNLLADGVVRVALGQPRDVVMIDGRARALDLDALPPEWAEHFVARTGFDPRAAVGDYRWFAIIPRRIQAWRDVDEIRGRDLMRDGRWLV